MTKLSKTNWFAVLTGVLVMAFGALGMTYSQHDNEQTRLNQELAQAQLLLNRPTNNFAEEKRRLDDTLLKSRSEFESLRATLSPGNESIEAYDNLFKVAQVSQVRIIDITATPPSRDKIGSTPFSALSLGVRLQGQSADILRFISTWTEQNITGVVRSVAVTRSRDRLSGNADNITSTDNVTATDNITATDNVTDNLTVPFVLPAGPDRLTATVSIVIYTYQGN